MHSSRESLPFPCMHQFKGFVYLVKRQIVSHKFINLYFFGHVFYTSFGMLSTLFHPPNVVPFHVQPVTSWNGRVAISSPEAATPTTTLTPQPLWQASSAALYRQRQDQITEVSAFPGRRRSASLETSQGEGGGAKPFFFF